MEETTMIVLKEMYLASRSKCLFRINSLFLIETSSRNSYLTSISNISYLANPFGRYHILAFWFEYYIPNIILVSQHLLWVCLLRSSTYPSLLHSTLKVGIHFTLGKVSIHHEAIHHVVLCRTQISSVVTPLKWSIIFPLHSVQVVLCLIYTGQ